MCVGNSNKAIPWGTKREGEELKSFRAEVCSAIKESIDRGISVNTVAEEEGLIIGYADEDRRWWCLHPYHKNGSEAFWYEGSGVTPTAVQKVLFVGVTPDPSNMGKCSHVLIAT